MRIDDGLDLEMRMINIELKQGYKSRSYERFKKFKQRYYDIFEDILLENGYAITDVPHIFYNHFKQWYEQNSKKIGNTTRVDVINWFLRDWQI